MVATGALLCVEQGHVHMKIRLYNLPRNIDRLGRDRVIRAYEFNLPPIK